MITRMKILVGLSAVALATAVWAQKEPVRIGAVIALTGPYGQLGGEVQRAIQYAVNEANAAGGIDGRNVEVRFLDTEGKPEIARTQAEKLALSGYNILTGSTLSSETLAIGPLLNRWNALYVGTVTRADDITGKQCQRVLFRANRPDYSEAVGVEHWLRTRKEKKWATLGADYAWGRNNSVNFKKAAAKNDKVIVSENYSPLGSSDFAAFIQKIMESGAEGLYVALAGRDALTFLRQAQQFGLLDKLTVAGTGYATESTVKAFGDSAKGLYIVLDYSATAEIPTNRKWVSEWLKAYPNELPTNFQGETYLGMQVIFQAVKKAGSINPVDLARAMEGATFETILGSQLMRAEDHQLIGPVFFGRVEDVNGMPWPKVILTVPGGEATPGPDPNCRL